MLRRVDGDPEILRSLIELFFKTYPVDLQSIENSIASEAFADAERVAHSLKGSLQIFFKGALPLAAYAVEEACRTAEVSLARMKVAELRESFASAQSCLDDLREYLE